LEGAVTMIDRYVVAVMLFSLVIIIFRSGMIFQKKENLTKQKIVVEIILLIPYILAVVYGIVLFILKEVFV
jgi:lysylphosphatidylglycerol synthetase-like protein (DUF2156 family)